MLLAPALGAPPREIAERLGAKVSERLGDSLERVEVAGPGFLNLFLADTWFRQALTHIVEAGDRFGAGAPARPERVLVEFVSAKPTGPPTAPGGPPAAHRDAPSRVPP